MMRMWKNGHNRIAAAALTATLALTPATALAQDAQGSSKADQAPVAKIELNGLLGKADIVIPKIPDIEVPKHVVDGAKKVGIPLPERITFPRKPDNVAVTVDKEQLLLAEAEKQLLKEGHKKDPEAQAIAAEWANQAVRGEAKFTGDVGRGTTSTERGTGNIYRMTPQQVEERIAYLNRDEVIAPVETTPVKDPKRFGVATAKLGETTYLVEYFLN